MKTIPLIFLIILTMFIGGFFGYILREFEKKPTHPYEDISIPTYEQGFFDGINKSAAYFMETNQLTADTIKLDLFYFIEAESEMRQIRISELNLILNN